MSKDIYSTYKADLPDITKKRSYFNLNHSHHMDMVPGSLYPMDQVMDVVPTDTFIVGHKLQIRMTNPPKTPTMDQLVLDIYFFGVQNRLVWDNWNKFITNYDPNFYSPTQPTYPIIDIVNPNAGTGNGYAALDCSVLDYLTYGGLSFFGSGIDSKLNPSALYVRGFYKIWNEYFRYESLQTEILVPTGDNFTSYTNLVGPVNADIYNYFTYNSHNADKWTKNITRELFGLCLPPVNRLPDYFSRALPQPLAGADVKILDDFQLSNPTITGSNTSSNTWASLGVNGLTSYGAIQGVQLKGINSSGTQNATISSIGGSINSSSNSIRSLANAIALNRYLYIDNVYGRRITEWTYGHFGANVPDSRAQRPEFLGKKRIYININQIMQASETSANSPQGNAGAWSQTFDSGHDYTKSFTEYGMLFAVGCIRVLNHTYAQGLNRQWTRRTRFDYFLPEFQNTGDQNAFQYEIYANSVTPMQSWGYVERYAEYKGLQSRVVGYMKPQISGSLAVYHYADYYASAPSLSASWMFEPIENIERTMYFSFETVSPFLVDIVWDVKAYRSMQYTSMPGELTQW